MESLDEQKACKCKMKIDSMELEVLVEEVNKHIELWQKNITRKKNTPWESICDKVNAVAVVKSEIFHSKISIPGLIMGGKSLFSAYSVINSSHLCAAS